MDIDNKAIDEGPDHGGIEDEGGDEFMSHEEIEDQCASEAAGECEASDPLPDDVTALSPENLDFTPHPHSLLAVLLPAKPPQARNARIVRLFDLEAAKHDPKPEDAPVVEQPKEEPPRSREAVRAARNQSLLIAAGLR